VYRHQHQDKELQTTSQLRNSPTISRTMSQRCGEAARLATWFFTSNSLVLSPMRLILNAPPHSEAWLGRISVRDSCSQREPSMTGLNPGSHGGEPGALPLSYPAVPLPM